MLRLSCLSFLLLISASVACADTVFIQSGTGFLTPSSIGVVVTSSSNMSGNIGATGTFGTVPCMPCTSGQTLSLSGNSGGFGSFDGFGSFVFNGVQYFVVGQALPPPPPLVIITGGVSFLAGSVIPPMSTDPFITVTAPFTVQGGFNASAVSTSFSVVFNGSGIASLVLQNRGLDGQGRTLYNFQSIRYDFQTPEPTTFILFATGLFGGVVQYKRPR